MASYKKGCGPQEARAAPREAPTQPRMRFDHPLGTRSIVILGAVPFEADVCGALDADDRLCATFDGAAGAHNVFSWTDMISGEPAAAAGAVGVRVRELGAERVAWHTVTGASSTTPATVRVTRLPPLKPHHQDARAAIARSPFFILHWPWPEAAQQSTLLLHMLVRASHAVLVTNVARVGEWASLLERTALPADRDTAPTCTIEVIAHDEFASCATRAQGAAWLHGVSCIIVENVHMWRRPAYHAAIAALHASEAALVLLTTPHLLQDVPVDLTFAQHLLRADVDSPEALAHALQQRVSVYEVHRYAMHLGDFPSVETFDVQCAPPEVADASPVQARVRVIQCKMPTLVHNLQATRDDASEQARAGAQLIYVSGVDALAGQFTAAIAEQLPGVQLLDGRVSAQAAATLVRDCNARKLNALVLTGVSSLTMGLDLKGVTALHMLTPPACNSEYSALLELVAHYKSHAKSTTCIVRVYRYAIDENEWSHVTCERARAELYLDGVRAASVPMEGAAGAAARSVAGAASPDTDDASTMTMWSLARVWRILEWPGASWRAWSETWPAILEPSVPLLAQVKVTKTRAKELALGAAKRFCEEANASGLDIGNADVRADAVRAIAALTVELLQADLSGVLAGSRRRV